MSRKNSGSMALPGDAVRFLVQPAESLPIFGRCNGSIWPEDALLDLRVVNRSSRFTAAPSLPRARLLQWPSQGKKQRGQRKLRPRSLIRKAKSMDSAHDGVTRRSLIFNVAPAAALAAAGIVPAMAADKSRSDPGPGNPTLDGQNPDSM